MTEDEKVENTLVAQAIINDAIKKYYERCKEKVMTPTDAQKIEEFLGLFENELTAQQRKFIADQICRKFLTAAAEVGPRLDELVEAIRKPQDAYNNTVCPDCKVWPCKCPRVTR